MTFRLDQFLPYRLAIAAHETSRRFAALYAREGVTIPEWRVLAHLAHSGPASIRDLTARVHLEKSVVSRAASRLRSRNLVTKTPHETDRRLITLNLTQEGQALMTRLTPLADAFQTELETLLGPDTTPLTRALTRLAPSNPDRPSP